MAATQTELSSPAVETAEAPAETRDAGPRRRSSRRRWVAWLVGGLLVAVGVIWGLPRVLHSLSTESTDSAFIETDIHPVSARVSGQIAAVHVEDNQWVEEGQLLVELAPEDFEVEVAAAKADLAAAKARLEAARDDLELTRATTDADIQRAGSQVTLARATVSTARAEVAAAEAELQRAERDYERDQKLRESDVIAEQALEHSRLSTEATQARREAARQRVAEARAKLAALGAELETAQAGEHRVKLRDAEVRSAEAAVAQAEARLRRAELDLGYTKIQAPAAGRVTEKAAETGAHVQPGQSLLAVVPAEVWVKANFKETQLGKIHPGQSVAIHVDTYPDVTFAGHVESIQRGTGAAFSLLPPQNATGNYVKVVQRVPVKIVFDEQPDPKRYVLAPGMSVVPEVGVAESPAPPTAPDHQAEPGRQARAMPAPSSGP